MRTEAEASKVRYEARETQLALQNESLQSALQKEAERVAVLEVEIRQAHQANQEEANEPSSTPYLAADENETSLNTVLKDSRAKITSLELKLQHTEEHLSSKLREAETRLSTENERSESLKIEILALKNEVETATAAAETSANARRAVEAKCAELEAEIMRCHAKQAGSRSSNEGDAALIRTLTQQLKTAETAAKEAAHWKDLAQHATKLQERLDMAEIRARRAEGVLEAESQVHAELASVQAELDRWKTVLTGVADCTTPEEVLNMIKSLQERQVAAAAGEGDKAEILATARANAEASQRQAKEAEEHAEIQRSRADAAESAAIRANKRIEILQREKDSLRAYISSYEQEYLSESTKSNDKDKKRIADLEATLETLNDHIAVLETQLANKTTSTYDESSFKAIPVEEYEAIVDLKNLLAATEERAATAETQLEELSKLVDSLQMRVARGEFNPETTKVLHLKNNPEAELHKSMHEAKVAQLESENEALRVNIQRLESAVSLQAEGRQAPLTEGSGLRIAQIEGEANLLRRRLSDAQKVSDRLQQVFTRQIATFREAVGGLFGYRVEMTSDPSAREKRAEFVLRPIQATDPSAQLRFQMLRDGRLIIIPTDYSRQLAREVEIYIDRFHSIPALTANLTMELFQQQTQT